METLLELRQAIQTPMVIPRRLIATDMAIPPGLTEATLILLVIRVPHILTGTAEAQVRQIVIQTRMVTLVRPTETIMGSLSALHQATPTLLATPPLSNAAITPTPASGLGNTLHTKWFTAYGWFTISSNRSLTSTIQSGSFFMA